MCLDSLSPLMLRFPVPAEDFEIAMRAYEWPRKMIEIMKEATTKANAEHKDFEQQLKKRRKVFILCFCVDYRRACLLQLCSFMYSSVRAGAFACFHLGLGP